MTFIVVFLICLGCGAVWEQCKRNKIKAQATAQATVQASSPAPLEWMDFGPSIEIAGKTFVKDKIDYVYKGLYVAQMVGSPNVIYGMNPGIQLTKQEFLHILQTI